MLTGLFCILPSVWVLIPKWDHRVPLGLPFWVHVTPYVVTLPPLSNLGIVRRARSVALQAFVGTILSKLFLLKNTNKIQSGTLFLLTLPLRTIPIFTVFRFTSKWRRKVFPLPPISIFRFHLLSSVSRTVEFFWFLPWDSSSSSSHSWGRRSKGRVGATTVVPWTSSGELDRHAVPWLSQGWSLPTVLLLRSILFIYRVLSRTVCHSRFKQ